MTPSSSALSAVLERIDADLDQSLDRLFAFLKINLFLLKIDKTFNITPEIKLLDFDIPFTRVPTLATELGDGVLQLNMGKFAAQRLEQRILADVEPTRLAPLRSRGGLCRQTR